MEDKYSNDCYDIYYIHSLNFGRATSFVASFVEAVTIVNLVAVNTVLVLHLSLPGGLLAGRAVARTYGSVS